MENTDIMYVILNELNFFCQYNWVTHFQLIFNFGRISVGVIIQKEIESYYEVMEIYPKYPYIWYKLGLAYYAIGYKQKGKEYFHRMKATEKERKREDKMKQFRI